MNLIPVKSSNVQAVGYENNTLTVQFTNKKIYLYHEVPVDIFTEMLNSDSIGKYLGKHVYKKFAYSMAVKQEEGDEEDGKANEN